VSVVGEPDTPEARAEAVAAERARKRRLAEIFGDVLPDQTSDDADAPGESGGRDEQWYRQQTPPHHG
jgi:hypothetical protein